MARGERRPFLNLKPQRRANGVTAPLFSYSLTGNGISGEIVARVLRLTIAVDFTGLDNRSKRQFPVQLDGYYRFQAEMTT